MLAWYLLRGLTYLEPKLENQVSFQQRSCLGEMAEWSKAHAC